jgi:hypothetical protein
LIVRSGDKLIITRLAGQILFPLNQALDAAIPDAEMPIWQYTLEPK